MTAQMLVKKVLPKNIVTAMCEKNPKSQVITCTIYNKYQKQYKISFDDCTSIISLIKTL